MNFRKLKQTTALVAVLIAGSFSGQAAASTLTGGDAVDQASADAILDIVFTIDTSGSMYDDISAIGNVAASVVANLQCDDTDVWVRARFMGINYAANSYTDPAGIFDEGAGAYIRSNGRSTATNSIEDNGVIVSDIIANSDLFFNDDSTVDQDYYQAIVTIGDEGTQNGWRIYQDDIDAAYQANQDAINSGTFLFGWVVDDPYPSVPELFGAMAEGGQPTIGSYAVPTFGDTGGAFIQMGSGDSQALASTLEDIICTAASGGTGGGNGGGCSGNVPEPSTIALLGLGLTSFGFSLRRRKRSF